MGFEPQIRRIVERSDLPPTNKRQTLMFSATFAPPIQRVAASYLRAPYAHVAVGRVGAAIGTVEQRLVDAGAGDKRTKLALVATRRRPPGTAVSASCANRGITQLLL